MHQTTLTTCEERGVLAAAFYLAGGLVALVASFDVRSETRVLLVVVGCAVTVSLGAYVWRRRFVYSATIITSVLGPPLIAVAVVAGNAGWASAATATMYTFVAVHTALVLRWHHALAVFAWGALTAAAAANITAPAVPLLAVIATYVVVCGTLWRVTAGLVRRVQRQAATDSLTGLANRSAFYAALEYARATVERTDEPLSLLALDLDDFKLVNDRHGHAAGDALLVAVGEAWSQELRERDVLARVGGDEFSVVLPGADLPRARTIAQRLARVVPAGSSCSVGVATWEPDEELEALVRRADRDLYANKSTRARSAGEAATQD